MGRPSVPLATRSRSATNTGAERSTRPHWAGTPAASTAATSALAPARSLSSGFSQKMARPAARARSTAGRWAEVGVQIQTASQRATTASADSTTLAPMASAKPWARRAEGS